METSTPASGSSSQLRLLPLVLLLLLGVVWSLAPSITKFVVLAGIAPLGLVFWQTFIGKSGQGPRFGRRGRMTRWGGRLPFR